MNFSIGGLVEAEAAFESGEATSSDIVAATVEIALDAEINKNVKAHVQLLWEEEGPIEMDEATIEVAAPYGLTVTLGKMYVPFGLFNSHFITDPETLELGETNESAALVSYNRGIFSGSLGIFNGDVDEAGDGDVISDLVFSLTAAPRDDLTFGLSYISDVADSDLGITAASIIGDTVGGIALFVTFIYERFTIDGEYVGALADFNPGDLIGGGERPRRL